MQTELDRLGGNSEVTGLKISIDRTKVLRLRRPLEDRLRLNSTDVEDTDSFVYLGAFGNNLGGAEEDIQSRLGKTLFFIDFQRCGEHVNFAEKLR